MITTINLKNKKELIDNNRITFFQHNVINFGISTRKN